MAFLSRRGTRIMSINGDQVRICLREVTGSLMGLGGVMCHITAVMYLFVAVSSGKDGFS